MSVLAPLYFLGALAVGLPILFHLIRRRPRGEVEFSSLMFLQQTPPRLTKRSRLENWPLLLMRALALLLLAAAFARPFLRNASFLQSETQGRRLMLVIDNSASMQRAGMWEQAKEKANGVIDDLTEGDQLAIVAFDSEPKTLLSYDQSAELTAEQIQKTARAAINSVVPSWRATNMGAAISYAADLAATYEPDDETTDDSAESVPRTGGAVSISRTGGAAGPANMILISDMQEGSNIESLQVYSWPKELSLDVRRVVAEQTTNASAQILSETQNTKDGARIRVRVNNSNDAHTSRFRLAWIGGDSQNAELPIQVPPGETRVIRMPLPGANVTSLVLKDDDHSFDNQRYLVSPQPEDLTLLYVGSDASENSKVAEARDSLLFYLQRVPLNNQQRTVTVTPLEPKKLVTVPDVKTTPLVIVGQPLSTDAASHLKKYVDDGGKLLFVMSQESDADMLSAIQLVGGGDKVEISEAKVKDYSMFSQIDFGHPIFQPMSDPQFNDFTKVRFWSHRKVTNTPDDWATVAQFDDGDPAIIEKIVGDGRMWILCTGWQPKSSQLALSTKFLPLIYSFFNTLGGDSDQYGSIVLGEPIPYPPSDQATIAGPDGMKLQYKTKDDLEQVDQPGVYQFTDADRTRSFAVNLAESESRTTPMGEDALERFGIKIGETLTVAQTQANQRQLRDIELEKTQKLWQWLLVAALVLLAIETIWGGLLSRGSPKPEPA